MESIFLIHGDDAADDELDGGGVGSLSEAGVVVLDFSSGGVGSLSEGGVGVLDLSDGGVNVRVTSAEVLMLDFSFKSFWHSHFLLTSSFISDSSSFILAS